MLKGTYRERFELMYCTSRVHRNPRITCATWGRSRSFTGVTCGVLPNTLHPQLQQSHSRNTYMYLVAPYSLIHRQEIVRSKAMALPVTMVPLVFSPHGKVSDGYLIYTLIVHRTCAVYPYQVPLHMPYSDSLS